jgi:hypothetical protein
MNEHHVWRDAKEALQSLTRPNQTIYKNFNVLPLLAVILPITIVIFIMLIVSLIKGLNCLINFIL